MRHMSFRLTTEQVRNRTKTVTRRLGWKTAKVGDVVQPVVKGQGLKKGEKVETLGGPIRFVAVDRQMLSDMTDDPAWGNEECRREGFPLMIADEFVEMFSAHNHCNGDTDVTRIEFEYLDAGGV